MSKRILVFGDSNTWGWKPDNQAFLPIRRWEDEERFTGIMQAELGEGYKIVTEGLNARTTVWEDPIEGDRCGMRHLYPLMDSHAPLDLVIIFLGSNDLKTRFSVTGRDIGQSVGKLAEMARKKEDAYAEEPKVMVIAPPPLTSPIRNSMHAHAFEGGEEKSIEMAAHIKLWGEAAGAEYMNAGDVISSSDTDGLHLDKKAHEILGKAVADRVKAIFEKVNV